MPEFCKQCGLILPRVNAALHRCSPYAKPPAPPECVRCNDTGLVEYTGGEHLVGNARVTATPERPIYVQCKCVFQRPTAAQPNGRRYGDD